MLGCSGARGLGASGTHAGSQQGLGLANAGQGGSKVAEPHRAAHRCSARVAVPAGTDALDPPYRRPTRATACTPHLPTPRPSALQPAADGVCATLGGPRHHRRAARAAGKHAVLCCARCAPRPARCLTPRCCVRPHVLRLEAMPGVAAAACCAHRHPCRASNASAPRPPPPAPPCSLLPSGCGWRASRAAARRVSCS